MVMQYFLRFVVASRTFLQYENVYAIYTHISKD